jgi:hypothetical protein
MLVNALVVQLGLTYIALLLTNVLSHQLIVLLIMWVRMRWEPLLKTFLEHLTISTILEVQFQQVVTYFANLSKAILQQFIMPESIFMDILPHFLTLEYYCNYLSQEFIC